jgi:hypothetical protein
MKKMLLAATLGLLCIAAAGGGNAQPTSVSPSGAAQNQSGASVTADPMSPSEYLPKLQEFYERGKAIYESSRSDRLTSKEVSLHFNEFLNWANETGKWLTDSIGPAATARFSTWHLEIDNVRKLKGHHPEADNNKFRALTTALPQVLDNLKAMMAPGGMDGLKAHADGPK